MLTYRDLSESAMEQANYLRHMERGDRAYTRERFEELAPLMGVTVLQTSLPAGDRMVKACRRNGAWVAVNCKKKRVAMLEALNTSLEVLPKLG